jgi:hypothetical protein
MDPISNKNDCAKLIRIYYKKHKKFYNNKLTIADMGGEGTVKKKNEEVKSCFIKFHKELKDKYDELIKQLRNTRDIFELDFKNSDLKNIYNENTNMANLNSIRKAVISEAIKKETVNIEKDLIEKRFNFSIYESKNIKKSLLTEKNSLLNAGFDEKTVDDIFVKFKRFYF